MLRASAEWNRTVPGWISWMARAYSECYIAIEVVLYARLARITCISIPPISVALHVVKVSVSIIDVVIVQVP